MVPMVKLADKTRLAQNALNRQKPSFIILDKYIPVENRP